MGARVFGAGTGNITIYAVDKLTDSEYTVMTDRIEAATFACAVAAAGGELYMEGIKPGYIRTVTNILKNSGAAVAEYPDSVYVGAPSQISCPQLVSTGPYPGFPTDAQSLLMSVMSCSKGSGVIRENIFENRFGHAQELRRLGADIIIDGRSAYVRGAALTGGQVTARDLRSGAALVVAALAAEGETTVEKAVYIDRGYDDLVGKLGSLGASIERVN